MHFLIALLNNVLFRTENQCKLVNIDQAIPLFLFPVLFFTENLPSPQEKKNSFFIFFVEGQKPTLPRMGNKNKTWNGLNVNEP